MKIKIILTACILAFVLALACSCNILGNNSDTGTGTNSNTGTNTNTEPTEVEYKVKVVDYKGNPVSSGLFVQMYYEDGTELGGMKKANSNGEVTFNLEKGNYKFEIIVADDGITYNKDECVLTENATTKEVMLYNILGESALTIYPYNADGETYQYNAKFVKEGATRVDIDKMSYYIFQPTRGGVYKFSYVSDVALTIGFYGGSEHFVFQESTIPVVDGAFTMEIKDSSVSSHGGDTTKVIIGVKSLAVDNCILVVDRIGDAEGELQRVEYAPKEVPMDICKYNYLNNGFVDFDVTDPNLKVVYNENDGYYHVGDENGEIVLVRITTTGRYFASFTKILETTNLFAIIYDENGKPLRSEIYNSMFEAYAEKCDETGVVPLTKELEYAIKNLGNYNGWWGENSIFKSFETDDDGNVIEGEAMQVNPETAWLFACCYVDETAKGNKNNKIVVTDTAEAKDLYVKIDTGSTLYFVSSQQVKATLRIENAQGLVVIYKGSEIRSVGDTINIVLNNDVHIEFAIKNETGVEKDVTFTYTTFLG